MNIMVCVMTRLASREASYLQCLVVNYRLRHAKVIININLVNCMLMAAKHHIHKHADSQTHMHRLSTERTQMYFVF